MELKKFTSAFPANWSKLILKLKYRIKIKMYIK